MTSEQKPFGIIIGDTGYVSLCVNCLKKKIPYTKERYKLN